MITRTPLSVNVYRSLPVCFHLDTSRSVVVTVRDFSNTVHGCSLQDLVAFKLTWERPCSVTPSFISSVSLGVLEEEEEVLGGACAVLPPLPSPLY